MTDQEYGRCPICGVKLQLALARFDGETTTYVGYIPCAKHPEPTEEERNQWSENLKQLTENST